MPTRGAEPGGLDLAGDLDLRESPLGGFEIGPISGRQRRFWDQSSGRKRSTASLPTIGFWKGLQGPRREEEFDFRLFEVVA